MRLTGKSGIVVGAGQTPGDTIGNGRAAAMLFAREGANVMLVDRDLQRAEETAALIAAAGGIARCIAEGISTQILYTKQFSRLHRVTLDHLV